MMSHAVWAVLQPSISWQQSRYTTALGDNCGGYRPVTGACIVCRNRWVYVIEGSEGPTPHPSSDPCHVAWPRRPVPRVHLGSVEPRTNRGDSAGNSRDAGLGSPFLPVLGCSRLLCSRARQSPPPHRQPHRISPRSMMPAPRHPVLGKQSCGDQGERGRQGFCRTSRTRNAKSGDPSDDTSSGPGVLLLITHINVNPRRHRSKILSSEEYTNHRPRTPAHG